MARKARIDIPNYFYHIMARGQRKNPLFFSNADRDKFIEILKELLGIFDILIYAFAILGNHFHLLVYRNKTSLAQFMKLLDTRYALYFNKKYGTTGHVFQDRPKTFIVLDNKYLMYLVKYINLNPENAGIVENANSYFYCSANCYYNNVNCDLVSKLKIFSGLEGMKKYRKFVNNGKNTDFDIYEDAIGTEEQYKKLEKRTENRKKSYSGQRRNNDEIKEIKRFIMGTFGSLKLTKRCNDRESASKRRILILKLYKKGFMQSNIAKVFGLTRSAVNMIIKRNKKK